jgi:hypothetical protein
MSKDYRMLARSLNGLINSQASGPSAAAATPFIQLSADERRLLERCSSEIKVLAISAVAILGFCNVVEAAPDPALPRDLHEYAPFPPHTLVALEDSRLGQFFTRPVLQALGSLAYCAGLARAEFEVTMHVSKLFGSVKNRDIAEVKKSFDRVSWLLVEIVTEFDALYRKLGDDKEVAELEYVLDLLNRAINGRSPLTDNGKLIKPRIDFNIRGLRLTLNANAILVAQSSFFPVLIKDISQGGAGISGADRLFVDCRIELRLKSGRVLSGMTRWVQGDNAGIKFHNRLGLHDPLLSS